MANKYINAIKSKKKLIFILGGILVLVWVLFFLNTGTKAPSVVGTEKTGESLSRKAQDGLTTNSPLLAKESENYAKDKASEAEKEGKSNVSVPLAMPQRVVAPVVPDQPPKQAPAPTLVQPKAVPTAEERINRRATTTKERDEVLEASVSAAIAQAANVTLPKPGNVVVSTAYLSEKRERENEEKKQRQEASTKAAADAGKESVQVLKIPSGEILYGITTTASNSDQPGTPVTAQIVSGQYRGAKFIGAFQRQEEKIIVKFTKCIFNGQEYGVNGFAVDPKTALPAVASSVDTHFLSRWGGLVASAFLEGFGRAISQGGTTTTTAYGTTSTMPKLDLDQQLWAAGGVVGQKAGQRFERNFDTPPTVTIKSGMEIGILII